MFVGKDASVNLARLSFDEKDNNKWGKEKLSLSEMDVLN